MRKLADENHDDDMRASVAAAMKGDEPEGDSDAPVVETTEESPAKETQQDAAPPKEEQAAAPEETPEPKVIPAPIGWSDEAKAHFAQLPPELQQIVADRESQRDADHGRKSQEIADQRSRLEALDRVVTPDVRQFWQMHGMSEDQGIARLLAAQQRLNNDPARGLMELAQSYGVDLSKLTQTNRRPVDPTVAALQQQVQQLTNQLQSSTQQQKTQQATATEQTITRWAQQAGDDGKPLHPHFAAVEQDMMGIIPALKRSNPSLTHQELLDQAYERAVYANPDIRSSLIDAQVREAQAKREAKAKADAQKAKAASASVSSDTSDAPSTPIDHASVRDAVKAAMQGSSV